MCCRPRGIDSNLNLTPVCLLTLLTGAGLAPALPLVTSLTYGSKEVCSCPHWFGSVDRALDFRLKGPRFNSSQGLVPWLWAHPQWGVCRRQLIDVSLSSMFLTLYPSPFLSVKKSVKKYLYIF
uniref:Uncharacterized protein n=1 Tax=Myotis myotis TaxID=51298 RepID=A0A7J7VYI4_MYOMY|nr:hypothetical protein mMyoMyo1_012278 [Myotis myotis]